jgi:hypothetical protein
MLPTYDVTAVALALLVADVLAGIIWVCARRYRGCVDREHSGQQTNQTNIRLIFDLIWSFLAVRSYLICLIWSLFAVFRNV